MALDRLLPGLRAPPLARLRVWRRCGGPPVSVTSPRQFLAQAGRIPFRSACPARAGFIATGRRSKKGVVGAGRNRESLPECASVPVPPRMRMYPARWIRRTGDADVGVRFKEIRPMLYLRRRSGGRCAWISIDLSREAGSAGIESMNLSNTSFDPSQVREAVPSGSFKTERSRAPHRPRLGLPDGGWKYEREYLACTRSSKRSMRIF